MATRRRSGSGSKRHLKEKVVQIYESLFKGDDLTLNNPAFWDEFFLLKPNVTQLGLELNKLNNETLINLKENLNILVSKCIHMLIQKHNLRLVYSLQTFSAILTTMYQKVSQDSTTNIQTILFESEESDSEMKLLLERCSSILTDDVPDSLKTMVLKLLLIIITGMDNVDDNPLIIHFMNYCIFDPLVQLLCTSNGKQHHGYDIVMILTLLVNYKKPEVKNPYLANLSILDDELALNGIGQVIMGVLNEHTATMNQTSSSGGWFSSITSMVGGIFLNDETQSMKGLRNSSEVGMLLALYSASHLNRNFMMTLAHSTSAAASAPPSPPATLPPHQGPPNEAQMQALENDIVQPSNLLATFFQYCSIVMADTKNEMSVNKCNLCFITLTCITEEQFANLIMHDQNLTFKVQLYRTPMRHRKLVPEELKLQTLASTLIDLLTEFIMCHLLSEFPYEQYDLCIGVLLRLLSYQKRCCVRLSRDWRPLWDALITLLKHLYDKESTLLKKHNVFVMALQVVNIFNLFITFGDTFLSSPASYDQLYYELIRTHQTFDNLRNLAIRYSNGNDTTHKIDALRLRNSLENIRVICVHLTSRIDDWLKEQKLSTPTEDQILEVMKKHYDTLILKLQEGLETYEKHTEEPYLAILSNLKQCAARHTRQQINANAMHQQAAAMFEHYTSKSLPAE